MSIEKAVFSAAEQELRRAVQAVREGELSREEEDRVLAYLQDWLKTMEGEVEDLEFFTKSFGEDPKRNSWHGLAELQAELSHDYPKRGQRSSS
jgi:hypothetical protein